MPMFMKISAIALLALFIVACSAEEEPTGVIPEGHLKALEKANNVEDLLNDAQKKQLEEVDGATD